MLTLKTNFLKYKNSNGNMEDSGMLFAKNETDITLTESGVAADAKVVGDELKQLSEEIAHYITPEMFGAKGDGTTDDSSAIQQAIDTAGNNAVIYLGKKTYNIASTLNIHKRHCRFVCDGILKYTGTDSAVKMYNMVMSTIDIFAIEAPDGTALLLDSTEGEIGNCIITINYIFSSKIGVHLRGVKGNKTYHNIFYNKLHLEGVITSTDTCIYIEPVTSLINENYFWIGRVMGGANYGVKINSSDEFGGMEVNGNAGRNIFNGGNFEGLSNTGYSIYLHNSNLNVFRDFRTEEAYGKYVIGLSGECFGNDIGLSRITLSEIDISNFTSSKDCANILRSPQIIGSASDNFTGQNKLWLTTDGFSNEMSDIAENLKTETWIFTLKDGTVIEKQVTVS